MTKPAAARKVPKGSASGSTAKVRFEGGARPATLKAKSSTKPSASTANNTSRASTKPDESDKSSVNPAKLAWSTVRLPSEAQAGGAGVTESDFFDSLNWDDDDFMGLQEIDDVGVIQETRSDGSKTTKFVASQKKIKSKDNKGKQTAPAISAQKPELEPSKLAATTSSSSKKRKREAATAQEDVRRDADADLSGPSHQTEDESAKSVSLGDEIEDTGVADDGDVDMDDEDLAAAFRDAQDLELDDDDEDEAEFEDDLLPAWSHIPLHGAIKRALLHKKFAKPTEIQSRSLPPALGLADSTQEDDSDDAQDSLPDTDSRSAKRDVVGVSQTGSGKTLAYGLPILDYLYKNAENATAFSAEENQDEDEVPPPLGALILCPTRELALQVSSHLSDIVRASCLISADDNEISKRKLLRRPQIAVVCGGMSEQKQRRLLEGRSRNGGRKVGVDIIVATPGRLWEMTRLDDHLAARIKQTRFLVLDEADRMVEVGHFAEMEHILNLVNRAEAIRPSEGKDGQQHGEDDESDQDIETLGARPNENMQTFVFSATLSKALQINLKRRKKVKQFTRKKHLRNRENATTLEDLMERVDFRDEEPVVVDLTPGQGLPEGLRETKIECVSKDKDLYLYYFLLRYPGRSLVFVNSIDGIRRLAPILAQLNITTYPIHSQLQQKQRLKNLDRFRSFNPKGKSANCVLLATDVAARGLDIPSVEHVVHYQLPRSADTYVHRSGRTARAGSSGVSLALIEPKEKTLWSQLCRAMGRKSDIATFPVTFSTLTLLRERVELALAIDKQSHQNSKQVYEDNWLAKLAEEADLDLSDDDLDPDAPLPTASTKSQTAKNAAKLNEMKAKLAQLLQKPVTMKGLSHRYLTASGLQGSAWVDDMVANRNHDQIVGVANTDAQTDLGSKSAPAQAKSAKKAVTPPQHNGSKKTMPEKSPSKTKKNKKQRLSK
ncbi:P-loop containing nucleoside triphosphate hydrolase protein [Testicularia cyperi]|uniref:ATP-dependent RNA helicase n=1 Tax=Testicularia cyperi TaxID=1882483 RepID=A0A317XWY0_9BASI|nr:P-loop containing nucleoside triphosphate hydrolase protein [Testicularia cyperi]